MSTTMSKQDPRSPEKIQQRQAFAPPVDVFENKDELVILADLPGVAREELQIHVDKDQLTIEGRRGAGDDAFDYRRTFVVPRGIDAEKIAANLTSGVLRLVLPKPAALKPRQIEVKAG
jgi:HSP20 family protein